MYLYNSLTHKKELFVPNLRRGADDRARAVVDDEPTTNLRGGMDLNSRPATRDLGHPAADKFHAVGIKPVGDPIIHHGVEAVIQPEDLKFAAGRRVVALVCLYGFF